MKIHVIPILPWLPWAVPDPFWCSSRWIPDNHRYSSMDLSCWSIWSISRLLELKLRGKLWYIGSMAYLLFGILPSPLHNHLRLVVLRESIFHHWIITLFRGTMREGHKKGSKFSHWITGSASGLVGSWDRSFIGIEGEGTTTERNARVHIMTGEADAVYRELQKHLDDMPVGYPATKSGVEIVIDGIWNRCVPINMYEFKDSTSNFRIIYTEDTVWKNQFGLRDWCLSSDIPKYSLTL